MPLLAFVGGVLAVAAKGWVDLILERLRERRQLVAAARIVEREFNWMGMYFAMILDAERWEEPGHWAFDHAVWREHKLQLASALGWREWERVSVAYEQVRQAETNRAEAIRETGEARPAFDSTHTQLVRFHESDVEEASAILTALALRLSQPSPRWLFWRIERWRTRRRAKRLTEIARTRTGRESRTAR